MNGTQLCKALQISTEQLAAWIEEGLPYTGDKRRRFDPDEVSVWLVAAGHADPAPETQTVVVDVPLAAPPVEQTILQTRDQVARYFNVATRTVASWIADGMPGRPGSPGRQDGCFPVDEIERWVHSRRVLPGDEAEDPRTHDSARLMRARAESIELDLALKRGSLVDAELMVREWVRFIHDGKTQMKQLPAWVLKMLPEDLPRKIRRRIRSGLQRRLHEIFKTLEMGLIKQAEALENGGYGVEPGSREHAPPSSGSVAAGGTPLDPGLVHAQHPLAAGELGGAGAVRSDDAPILARAAADDGRSGGQLDRVDG